MKIQNDWGSQCTRGREHAAATIDAMRETGNPLILRNTLDELKESPRGVFIGFAQQVAETLMRGG